MNKYALITGASSGLGLEFARIYGETGHNLLLIARSRDKLLQIKHQFENRYNIEVIVLDIDLSLAQSTDKIAALISEKGLFINVLVNAAGVGIIGIFCESDINAISNLLALNILTTVKLTHLVLGTMVRNNEGKILNVSSTAAFTPGPWFSTYHASKSFFYSFSRALSYEMKNTPVKITVLCPGQMDTNFQVASGMKSLRKNSGLRKSRLPAVVARIGFNAVNRGKEVCYVSFLDGIKIFLMSHLPTQLLIKLSATNNINKIVPR